MSAPGAVTPRQNKVTTLRITSNQAAPYNKTERGAMSRTSFAFTSQLHHVDYDGEINMTEN